MTSKTPDVWRSLPPKLKRFGAELSSGRCEKNKWRKISSNQRLSACSTILHVYTPKANLPERISGKLLAQSSSRWNSGKRIVCFEQIYTVGKKRFLVVLWRLWRRVGEENGEKCWFLRGMAPRSILRAPSSDSEMRWRHLELHTRLNISRFEMCIEVEHSLVVGARRQPDPPILCVCVKIDIWPGKEMWEFAKDFSLMMMGGRENLYAVDVFRNRVEPGGGGKWRVIYTNMELFFIEDYTFFQFRNQLARALRCQ